MYSFISFIESFVSVPEEHKQQLQTLINTKQIYKGDSFIDAGQTPKSMAFVQKGLFRYFYTNEEGIEFTKGFFPENRVLISYSAILQNRESYFTIQALEDSQIEVISYAKLDNQFSMYSWFNSFIISLIQKAYIIKEDREREFLLMDAEQRYEIFFKRFPGLDKRIKQHMIASYLGITPESLSRIKKKSGFLS